MSTATKRGLGVVKRDDESEDIDPLAKDAEPKVIPQEHAVISTFDLFSIGGD